MKIRGLKKYVAALALLVCLSVLTACGVGGPASTGSGKTSVNSDYFKNKVVTIIVPYPTGASFDILGRLTAPYLQKYLPGSTVIVKNVPGAGSMLGTNQVYAAKPDGLTIGIVNTAGIAVDQAINAKGVKYDLNKFTWLGSFDTNHPNVLAVRTDTPYNSFSDLKKATKQEKISATGPGSGGYITIQALKKFCKLNLQLVSGYPGAHDSILAAIRGEVNGTVGTMDNLETTFKNHQLRPLVAFSPTRSKEAPDVPTIVELTSGQTQQAMKPLSFVLSLGYTMAAPPGVNPAVAVLLRTAYQKALQDPGFVAQATKANIMIDYVGPADTLKMIQEGLALPDNVQQLLAASQ